MTGEENEGTAAGSLDELARHFHHGRQKLRRCGKRHVWRQIKEALARKIERAVDLQCRAAIEAQPPGERAEVLPERQGCGGEYPGAGMRLDERLKARRNVERQEAQRERACRHLEGART